MRFRNTGPHRYILLGVCLGVVLNLQIVTARQRCLERSLILPNRYLHFEGRSLNLGIESSSRPTHKIISYIFKIFVEEVLSYPNVEMIDVEDNFNMTDVIKRLSGAVSEIHADSIPKSMINLEVWVPPYVNMVKTLSYSNVRECGILRPASRIGWFIPKSLTKHIAEIDSTYHVGHGSIHWTLLKNKKFNSAFQITDPVLLRRIEILAKSNNGTYFCNVSEICDNGYYVPESCFQRDCAVLLSGYYNDTKFIIEHIQSNDLNVKVLWLGYNLNTAIKDITQTYTAKNSTKSLLILHWKPSEIIYPEDDFITVNFQYCNPSVENSYCQYEMMKIAKFGWDKLEKIAYPIFDSLLKMEFTNMEYEELVQIYYQSKQDSYEDMACQWMRKNQDRLIYWTTLSVEKPLIYIGGIFPISSTSYKGAGIVAGAKMAVEAANRLVFTDYKLSLLVTDGQCRAEKVMKAFIDYVVDMTHFEKLVGVLGPACSETVEPIAAVSKLLKTMVISYSAEGASFADREKYPYFFRTIGSNTEFMYVYLELLKQMKWKRVAALTEDGQKYTEYLSLMQSLLAANGISFIANVKFPRERKLFTMNTYLETLKMKRARIIIADINEEAARSVMCEAHKLKMTMKDGYVWFLPTWLTHDWYNTDFYNLKYNESINCTTSVMVNAINGYFSITHAFWAPDNATMQENITVSEWRNLYNQRTSSSMHSDYAGFGYDAVWTYVVAVDKLIKQDPEALTDLHSANTTDKLVRYVQETDFNGVSGRIKFRGGPSRFSTIHLIQWYNHTRNIVGYFEPKISDNSSEILGGTLTLNHSSIKWIAGQIPDDGREAPDTCSLEGLAYALNVGCEMAIVVLNIIIFSILIILILIPIWYYKKKIDNKMNKTQRYMQQLGIDPDMTSLTDLDKWEVPREHVVINRKLGQGAFGTVYGGEALIDPENGWVAVAVKTLKMGSTAEEKIDFLSEAEAMKRFDHKNIVRLLGLCTRSEPVYTIMEFMLYGDLKTFLLARRHLVRTKSEEFMEVSSKKLTTMALDVARALSYLAEMKYVHRDVASRNCLVNVSRTVKLGDFGMTRAMYESDYYRFNRKGMLPVRWMAPESLSLGVFSTSSDIWSYGVLVYEIITFGSFPFQGLSNNQVLEYVKNGHTLDIPSGVKPQLEVFLKSCWNQESKKRPKASEIVEFLANNPQLISPVLDGPISAVEMEGTDDLEVHLPDEFRKQSSVTGRNFPNGDINSSQTLNIGDSDMIQLDHVCPKEPLLKSGGTFVGTTGYVTLQSSQPDLLSDSDIDYSQHNTVNGGMYTQCH